MKKNKKNKKPETAVDEELVNSEAAPAAEAAAETEPELESAMDVAAKEWASQEPVAAEQFEAAGSAAETEEPATESAAVTEEPAGESAAAAAESPKNESPKSESPEEVIRFSRSITKLKAELAKDIVGMEETVDNVICAIIAGGNVLLEGVPGVGKTRLVRSLGKALNLPFSRIQFTPDLMPSDVTGSNIIEQDEKGRMSMVFQRGPIFANLVLADEINRATPKTQAAMLEVMQEHKVTVSKQTYKLAEPFFVLATQNPIEQDGTYPLPEAQMDRFMFKLIVNFPTAKELTGIVNMTQVTMDETAEIAIGGEEILEMRELAKTVPVIDDVLEFAVRVVANTHPELESSCEAAHKYLKFGASPRAAQALITCAKVRALMYGNYNVSYDDIIALAYPVLRHRIKLNYNAITDKKTVEDVIGMILSQTK